MAYSFGDTAMGLVGSMLGTLNKKRPSSTLGGLADYFSQYSPTQATTPTTVAPASSPALAPTYRRGESASGYRTAPTGSVTLAGPAGGAGDLPGAALGPVSTVPASDQFGQLGRAPAIDRIRKEQGQIAQFVADENDKAQALIGTEEITQKEGQEEIDRRAGLTDQERRDEDFKTAISGLAEEYGIDPNLISYQEPYSSIIPSEEAEGYIRDLFDEIGYESGEEDIKQLYGDIMSQLDKDWADTQQLISRQGGKMSRAALTGSLGGSFLAGQRQAGMATQEMLGRAGVERQNTIRQTLQDQARALIDEHRLSEEYGLQTEQARTGALLGLGIQDAEARAGYFGDVLGHIFGREEAETLATLQAEYDAGQKDPELNEPDDRYLDAFGSNNVSFDSANNEYYVGDSTVGIPAETVDAFMRTDYANSPGSYYEASSGDRRFQKYMTNEEVPGRAFAAWAEDYAKKHGGEKPTADVVEDQFINNEGTRKKFEQQILNDVFEQVWLADLQSDPSWDQSMDFEKKAREFGSDSAEDFIKWLYGEANSFINMPGGFT